MAGKFSLDLTKFCEKAKVAPIIVMKKVCFDMGARIQARTPKDTVRAATGWQWGVQTIPTYLPPPGKYPWPQPPQVPGFKADDVLFLANNVEYITVLESGSSDQAPYGMMKVTITEYQDYVARAVASL